MNTQNAQNAILDQLRAIPHGTKVRFHLRRPDGSLFSHTSAIDHDRETGDNGFDSYDSSVALATEVPNSLWEYNGWWATYGKGNRYMCAIVGIEPLAPELPDLETLQKWVADGTTVRIEYTHGRPDDVGPSPVTCKLLRARETLWDGLFFSVLNLRGGEWNMFLDPVKGNPGSCRPLVTSITPVTEAVAQTPEEIDTIMQAAAKSGAWVEAIMANGTVRDGVLLYDGTDYMPYRISDTLGADGIWMGPNCQSEKFRVVSVRELAPEKQTEAEMLALLQAAERDGNHVEATMCDGSKVTGEVSQLQTCASYHLIPSGMVRVSIGEQGASFGAKYDSERIAAVKLLPREEKRPDSLEVRIDGSADSQTVTFSASGAMPTDGGLPYLLATGNSTVTPTCCADVAPYIGRRVRVEDGIEGILTGCGIDDIGESWFGLDGDTPHNEYDQCYTFSTDGYDTWTFELLPDEPASSGNLLIEPKVPADLEPYIGRRVRVLAGEEREVVREGTLMGATWNGFTSLLVEGRAVGWAYGTHSSRSTLVEVLPELQAAEPDDCDDDLEDDADDAVSAGSIRMWEEPVLTYGTLQMQVDGKPALVVIGADGTLNAKENGRRLVLTSEGHGESKLTLAELLALAPPPSEVRAYEAFQDTVRTAITSGLVTA